MKTIVVRDVYTVDTISKGNNKAWNMLIDIAASETDDVRFDFKGIEVMEPWGNEVFKKLLGYENAYFKFYCAPRTASTIEAACKLGGLKCGRVENEEAVQVVVNTDEEKLINRIAAKLLGVFIEEQGKAVLEIHKLYDQIGSKETIDAIRVAINKFSEETGIKQFEITTAKIFLQKNIIELMATLIGECHKKGIEVTVKSEDKDVQGKIGLYQCSSARQHYTPDQKVDIINKSMLPYTVGMLTKYKSSKAKDEFGRFGEGKPAFCRVAVYKGITGTGEKAVAHFTTYHRDTFVTRDHWRLEHDGEELDRMETENFTVPVADLGLFDRFLGSKFHFILPIQHDLAGTFRMYYLDETGVNKCDLTIPERIKAVFDDWGIKYNSASLIHSISETMRLKEKME